MTPPPDYDTVYRILTEVSVWNTLSLNPAPDSLSCVSWWADIHVYILLFFQREKDLELAARIGRSLLQRNELLEAELGSQLDNRQQLEQQVRGRSQGEEPSRAIIISQMPFPSLSLCSSWLSCAMHWGRKRDCYDCMPRTLTRPITKGRGKGRGRRETGYVP